MAPVERVATITISAEKKDKLKLHMASLSHRDKKVYSMKSAIEEAIDDFCKEVVVTDPENPPDLSDDHTGYKE